MTWRQQMICRILLMIAGMLADNEALVADIRHLSNSISLYREPEAVREDS